MDINNNYKRFQSYRGDVKQNTFKQDFMEQNYKVEKKTLGEKHELETRKDLNKPDTSFLEKSTRIGINSQGQFFKK